MNFSNINQSLYNWVKPHLVKAGSSRCIMLGLVCCVSLRIFTVPFVRGAALQFPRRSGVRVS